MDWISQVSKQTFHSKSKCVWIYRVCILQKRCRIFIIIYAMSWSWIFIRFTICVHLLFNRLDQTFLYLRIGNCFVEWQNGIIFIFMLAPFSIPRTHMWQLYWLSDFWAAHSLWIKWMLLSTFFFFPLLEKTFTFYSNQHFWHSRLQKFGWWFSFFTWKSEWEQPKMWLTFSTNLYR